MAGSGTSWWKGCAIGCGLFVVLGILGTIGGGIAMLRPFHQAMSAREELDARFPDQESYTPPPDGAVPADRMEAFLAVRDTLMSHCGEFTEAMEQFRRMDALGEHPPAGVVVGEVLRTMRRALGMAGTIGRFNTDRNRALLEHGMGLGEYTYVYAVVYHGWLGEREENTHVKVENDDSGPRVRRDLRAMLRRQLDELTAAGGDPDLAVRLRRELVRLKEDRRRYPWRDGVPPALLTSLEPYRDRLESLYCPDMSPFELTIARSRHGGVSIHGD